MSEGVMSREKRHRLHENDIIFERLLLLLFILLLLPILLGLPA